MQPKNLYQISKSGDFKRFEDSMIYLMTQKMSRKYRKDFDKLVSEL